MKALFLVLLSSLAGCSSYQRVPPSAQVVEWVRIPADKIHQVCSNAAPLLISYSQINGCAIRTEHGCMIYAPDFTQDGHVLGHELKHCFDGNWHKSVNVQK